MGKATGFLEINKQEISYLPTQERINNYQEFIIPLNNKQLSAQGARCMDCGIPFCHQGCPINNLIPDWNDLVYQDLWQEALMALHATNNFPEFTGRICPAPCEAACTLNIEDSPVSIRTIECAIVDRGFAEGWIKPVKNIKKTNKKVAVIGSGPAGLACCQQLARAGHNIVLFEKEPVAGGLLRLGIPDFKLDKQVVQRRVEQLINEGVDIRTNTHIGVDIKFSRLEKEFNAIVLAGGAEKPRDLVIPGRKSKDIHFAMDFLKANSKWIQGIHGKEHVISAQGKNVVVIGGGDTGSDCVGTANRHGAKSVVQIDIMPKPPIKEDKATVWPQYPNKLRTSSSQKEGCNRMWNVATKEFISDQDGNLKQIKCVKVVWNKDDHNNFKMSEVANSEFSLDCELATLAMGFVRPVHKGMLKQAKVKLDSRGNVACPTSGKNQYKTTQKKVFATGDMRRGQSLVVWAIKEGRECAKAVDKYLMGSSNLP